jgi:hypothetical protein
LCLRSTSSSSEHFLFISSNTSLNQFLSESSSGLFLNRILWPTYDHGYSVSKDKSIDILASPTWPVDISETRKDIFFDHGYSSVSKDKDISVSPMIFQA